VKFIEEHGERWRVEPICRVLQFAPATYYAARTRPASAREPWDRELRDRELKPEIQRIWNENFRVYGADKVWTQLRREGYRVARCTVERLMRDLGLRGVVRGKTPRTTLVEDGATGPVDLVDRHFVAPAPNRLWVADLTYVKTHSGWVYVAFIVDVFSRYVVGWQASRSLRAELALDALEMAIWVRRGEQLQGPVHHFDQDARYQAVRYTKRLALAGPVGSRGDSYDNALAEPFSGRFRTEAIRRRVPGARSTTRSTPPRSGSTGSTSDASTPSWLRFPWPSPKLPSTTRRPQH